VVIMSGIAASQPGSVQSGHAPRGAISAPFAKMNGLGNKIIVVDMRDRSDGMTPEAAIALAANEETHFDQIMEIRPAESDGTDAYIRIWNADGSEAGACGNGMRCVVHSLVSAGGTPDRSDFLFETKAGVLNASFSGGGVITVDMGPPLLEWEDIPLEEEFADTRCIELQIGPIDNPVLHTPSVANMGNPHCIFWAPRDVWEYDLHLFGPILENHPLFPDRANISIANVLSPTHIRIRTWERGAGLTEACGSAACATLVSAHRLDLAERKATVTVPGGDLEIEWLDNGRVMMSGPAEHEWNGLLDPKTGDYTRLAEEA
jgi:diaminopimelate epimerase